LFVAGLWARPTSAETEYGGLDFSGFSAWGTTGGVGANATAGIPFGPVQKSRPVPQSIGPPPQSPPRSAAPWPRQTVAQQPAPLPSPPIDALPASSPPPDPVLNGPLLGAPELVGPLLSGDDHGTGLALPGAPEQVIPAQPPAVSSPGYGSPSLGYGPPVSYAPAPSYVPAPVIPPVTYAPPTAPPPPSPSELGPTWRDIPDGPERQFYLGSIVGADFGSLAMGNGPMVNGPLFTTGGVVGFAAERRMGWLRTEFEARYRDPVSLTLREPDLGGTASVTARDGWSTMINAWRDLEVTDRVALYLGGGIGGGGYTVVFDGGFPALGVGISGSTAVTGFAWQAGGGASWLVTERIALDLGYRWYAVDGGPATIDVATPIFSFSDSIGTNFGASELLFSLRVYEPFRRWGN
jgi:opacity protein-like surface antigen